MTVLEKHGPYKREARSLIRLPLILRIASRQRSFGVRRSINLWDHASDQLLEGSLQDFSRDLNKSLTGHWHHLCCKFLNLVFCSRFAAAPLSVRDRSSSAVPKRVKKPAATSQSPRSRKKLTSGDDKIKVTVSLASSSSSKPSFSSQSRFPSATLPKSVRRLRSSAFSALRSDDVDDDGAVVVHFNRNDSTGEDF